MEEAPASGRVKRPDNNIQISSKSNPDCTFSLDMPETFMRSIFRSVLVKPRQCKNGHLCCYDCVFNLLKTEKKKCAKCPECRISTSMASLSHNRIAAAFTDDLEVQCDQSDGENRCDWLGPMCLSDDHCRNSCEYVRVLCNNNEHGCSERILRKDLTEYEIHCSFNNTPYDLCQQ